MNTILSRGCKKCKGDLLLERDGLHGPFYMHCFQCAADYYPKPLPVLTYAHENSLIEKRREHKAIIQVRNAEIKRLHVSGVPIFKLSRIYHLRNTSIRSICSRGST